MALAKTVVVCAVTPVLTLCAWTIVASFVMLWGIGMIDAVAFPTWEWWGYLMMPMPDRLTQDYMNWWLEASAVAGIPAALLVLHRLAVTTGIIGSSGRPLHGETKFCTTAEGRKVGFTYTFRPPRHGLILGKTDGFFGMGSRYIGLGGVPHVMLYAKTESGKGVDYVMPNAFNYPDSMVITDLKNEIFEATAGHRESVLGQEIYRFSPLSLDGRTHCWNPLEGISVADEGWFNKIQQISYDLFPEVQGKEKFWQDGARSGFQAIGSLLVETPGMDLNPGNIFQFFVRGDAIEVLSLMIAESRRNGTLYTQNTINLISDYLNGSEEVVSGIRKHLTSTMGIWFNPRLVAATSRSDFSLRDLRRRKMTIYLGMMPDQLDQLGPLLRLFILRLYRQNADATRETDPTIRHRCHLLLDEFSALPVMRAIAKSVAIARGFWVHYSFIAQTKRDVSKLYQNDGEEKLLDNLGVEQAFATDNPQLVKELSERLGYNTEESKTWTAPRFMRLFRQKEQNETTHNARRALLLPQEISAMPKDRKLMFRDGKAFYPRRLCWYRDRWFRHLPQPAPEIPLVRAEMALDDGSVQIGPVAA
jgi:type IV secretion system protein VirD4